MKHGYLMTTAAAAVLAGLTVVGCGSKDDTTTATAPTHAAPDATGGTTVTTPGMPTADKTNTAMQNVGDKMKDMSQQAKDAGKSAGDSINSGMDKLKDKMGGGATTQPTMPSMPTMK